MPISRASARLIVSRNGTPIPAGLSPSNMHRHAALLRPGRCHRGRPIRPPAQADEDCSLQARSGSRGATSPHGPRQVALRIRGRSPTTIRCDVAVQFPGTLLDTGRPRIREQSRASIWKSSSATVGRCARMSCQARSPSSSSMTLHRSGLLVTDTSNSRFAMSSATSTALCPRLL